jgi:protein-tyrosine kinase
MEHIKKAIERAKQERFHLAAPPFVPSPAGGSGEHPPEEAARAAREPVPTDPAKVVTVDRRQLQAMRIVAYDAMEGHTAHYDMLRTQVLLRMEAASCRSIAVTSPRWGCGKTVTAINLALSMARQGEHSVVLVDLDLRNPQVARYLGLLPEAGVHDVVTGKCLLSDALLVPDLCGHRLAVLATLKPVANPVEHLVSSAMRTAVTGLKQQRNQIVVFDLPPMLSTDDFLAFLPQADCALVVASSGESTVHDIAECERLIDPAKFLGCVLNKVSDAEVSDHYYGSHS